MHGRAALAPLDPAASSRNAQPKMLLIQARNGVPHGSFSKCITHVYEGLHEARTSKGSRNASRFAKSLRDSAPKGDNSKKLLKVQNLVSEHPARHEEQRPLK